MINCTLQKQFARLHYVQLYLEYSYTHKFIFIHKYNHTYINTYITKRIYILYIHKYIHTYLLKYIYTYIYIHRYICYIYKHLHIHIHTYLYLRPEQTFTKDIHTYIGTSIHLLPILL